MLNFAIQTAREAGQILLEKFGRKINIEFKSEANPVTEADLASEKHIVEKIRSHYPKHSILAEESGVNDVANAEYKWIIDPLDGTTNYSHGYPCFCVSIGLEYQGEIVLGVIYDPTRDELFAAEKGQGATLNGRTMGVSEIEDLSKSLLVTGFPYSVVLQNPNFERNIKNFIIKSQAVRRDGSAALNMAYVACGRFDGFWEEGLNPWDMAAGYLLITEAGGRVTYYDGSVFSVYTPPVCCSNGLIHDQMLAILNTKF
jgi:myo-inositol-1(or 4)-monophosphatase